MTKMVRALLPMILESSCSFIALACPFLMRLNCLDFLSCLPLGLPAMQSVPRFGIARAIGPVSSGIFLLSRLATSTLVATTPALPSATLPLSPFSIASLSAFSASVISRTN